MDSAYSASKEFRSRWVAVSHSPAGIVFLVGVQSFHFPPERAKSNGALLEPAWRRRSECEVGNCWLNFIVPPDLQTAGKVAPLASTSSKRLSAVTRDSFHMFSRRHRHLESIVLSDSQLYAGASREDRKDLYLSLVGADGVVVRARDAIPVPEAVLPELEGRSATAHAKTIHNSEDESGVC
eukprot:m.769583 g.769583  ORF g.769583 m.769583 type:complete len:181 (-) comp59079_c0_seq54:4-546(-)